MPVRCAAPAEAVPSPERSRPSTALLRSRSARPKWGHMPELVTAISSVPPGAFNPTEGIEQVPLSCWCTRVVAEGKKAFHFWEKCHGGTVTDGVALAGESVTWHKSQDK